MEAGPTFSVIVPTYNRPADLRACLAALRAIEYPRNEFEVIVADDASEPALEVPVSADGMCIRLVRAPQNEGPAAARNRAASCARGKLLAFTDDDCLPERDWLTRLAAAFEESPAAVVGGAVLDGTSHSLFSAASAAITNVVFGHYNSDREHARFLSTANLAVPADVFRQLGGFDTGFRRSEDREFCDRCLRTGVQLRYDPRAVIVHHPASGFRAFWRRHHGYGEGAYAFWKHKRAADGPDMRREPSGFYGRLLCAPLLEERSARAVLLTALVLLSQCASALGFAAAARRRPLYRSE